MQYIELNSSISPKGQDTSIDNKWTSDITNRPRRDKDSGYALVPASSEVMAISRCTRSVQGMHLVGSLVPTPISD